MFYDISSTGGSQINARLRCAGRQNRSRDWNVGVVIVDSEEDSGVANNKEPRDMQEGGVGELERLHRGSGGAT